MFDKKMVIIGLDCAEPSLVFNQFADKLPNIQALMRQGGYASLQSTTPPITVPAWTSMMTSKDPGQLGIYGFRNRKSHDYDALFTANAQHINEKPVWSYLSRHRIGSFLLSIPQTYPPKPVRGAMVGCFLTPDKTVPYTYPPELASELDRAANGDYIIDVKDFRTDNKDWLLDQIHKMTINRFAAFRYFLAKNEFDFAMMVEMGVDRIHHGFWRFFDRSHRLYEPGNPYEHAISDYYALLDEEIGKTISMLPENTAILVVSDHGAKKMKGAICINEWLIKKGYLTLKEQVNPPVRMKNSMVDWTKTKAWGEGGYYSRLFLNVEGREPQGVIPASEYESFRDKIKAELEAMTDEEGNIIGTKAHKPEDIYKSVTNIPPDLVVILGNLDWRSSSLVGTGKIHMYENDTGPDDANHAQDGMLICKLPTGYMMAKRDLYRIYDVAPSVLEYFDIAVPEDMIGISFINKI